MASATTASVAVASVAVASVAGAGTGASGSFLPHAVSMVASVIRVISDRFLFIVVAWVQLQVKLGSFSSKYIDTQHYK
ncbi:MAG: hypothetical protein ACI9A1_001953 [Lentimonas sp.]